MSVMRSIPLFSIARWACYSVGTDAVGGLPNRFPVVATGCYEAPQKSYRPSTVLISSLPECL